VDWNHRVGLRAISFLRGKDGRTTGSFHPDFLVSRLIFLNVFWYLAAFRASLRAMKPSRFLFVLAAGFGFGAMSASASENQVVRKPPAQGVVPARPAEPLISTAIRHSFLAFGAETYIMSDDGRVVWSYPRGTRDGWALPNGHFLLAVSKDKDYPGGAALEVTREGKTVFEFKGTQSEVNTVQALDNGRVLLTEAGVKPRLLEVDRDGRIAVEVPLTCQNTNHHMESRMARKLPNGNYLVPQLLDKVVREYAPDGKIVWEAKTPGWETAVENWPFTAIRLPNGHTLINCTHGNMAEEVDADWKSVWQVENKDLPGAPIKDACGGQRLPNGNTVITSYGAAGDAIKLFEVTPEKRIVWIYRDKKPHGIHEFQILDTDGVALPWPPLR
jgi:hypothetical protein